MATEPEHQQEDPMSSTRRVSLKKRYPFSGKRSRNVGGNTIPVSDMVARGTHGDMVANGQVVAVAPAVCADAKTPTHNGSPIPVVLTTSAYAACVRPGAAPEVVALCLHDLMLRFTEAVRRQTGPRTGVLTFRAPFVRDGQPVPFRAVATRSGTGHRITICLAPSH
jgi:hypothetical protein